MNKAYILFHLKEAQEELGKTIHEIESQPDYDYGEYVVAMMHLYHHINTAWNARDVSPDVAERCSEDDFYAWRRFPSEDEIYLGK